MSRIPRAELQSRTWHESGSDPTCRRSNVKVIGLAAVLLTSLRLYAAGAPDTNEIPALIPPRPELLPSFWEQNRTWVLLVTAAAALAVGMVIWVLTRARPPAQVPPGKQARDSLQALASKQEDRFLLSEVSRILKGYFIAAFGLPPGEFTTAEFRHRLQAVPTINPEFSIKIGCFLERCDERKFALASEPESPMGAVAQATELVNAAEQLRAASENGANQRMARTQSAQPNR